MSMNWIDSAILLALICGGILGFISGFILQIIKIVGIVVAFFFTVKLHPILSGYFVGEGNALLMNFISYVIIFCAIYGLVFILSYLLEKFLKAMKLKTFDRVLGAILGFVKALLLCIIFVLGYSYFGGETASNSIQHSVLGKSVLWIGQSGKRFMPEKLNNLKRLSQKQTKDKQKNQK